MLVVAAALFFAVAWSVPAMGGPVPLARSHTRSDSNRAYFSPLETASHVPVVDGTTLPVGTVIDGNLWVHVTTDLHSAQGVIAINEPVKASWNCRTPGATIAVGDHLLMRFYQTLNVAGDWYITAKILSHSGGSLGTPTIIEVHVVP